MSRDILEEYGPESYQSQQPRATSGGVKMSGKRDVMNYAEPIGPTTFYHNSPGLAGHVNYGNVGKQGPKGLIKNDGGSPGIHDENFGYCGSQGKY